MDFVFDHNEIITHYFASRSHKLELKLSSKIKAAKTNDMEILDIRIPKDTDILQRYKVFSRLNMVNDHLK